MMEPLCGHDAHVGIVIFVVSFGAFEICASVYDADYLSPNFLQQAGINHRASGLSRVFV